MATKQQKPQKPLNKVTIGKQATYSGVKRRDVKVWPVAGGDTTIGQLRRYKDWKGWVFYMLVPRTTQIYSVSSRTYINVPDPVYKPVTAQMDMRAARAYLEQFDRQKEQAAE